MVKHAVKANLHDFKASLVYIAGSRHSGLLVRPLSQNK